MAEHKAWLHWKAPDLAPGAFRAGRYSRGHEWRFDGGVTLLGSASPHVVRPPHSLAEAVDPEEAMVASISSCHLLTFLYVASKAGFEVDDYQDEASGQLTKNERGVPWLSHVVLRPLHRFVGERQPTDDELERLHEQAHEECFIANSVKTTITVEWKRAPA